MYFKSKLEEKVFQAIKRSVLKHFVVKKEVAWSKIFNETVYRSRYVDYYFPQIQLIIEANGIQHYEPTSFTNDESTILGIFHNQRTRDLALVHLCKMHDVNLLVIPYTIEDIDVLVELINKTVGELYGSEG